MNKPTVPEVAITQEKYLQLPCAKRVGIVALIPLSQAVIVKIAESGRVTFECSSCFRNDGTPVYHHGFPAQEQAS